VRTRDYATVRQNAEPPTFSTLTPSDSADTEYFVIGLSDSFDSGSHETVWD